MTENKYGIRNVDLVAREKRWGEDLIQFCDGDVKLQLCMWQMATSGRTAEAKSSEVTYIMMKEKEQVAKIGAEDRLALKKLDTFVKSVWKPSREALFATIGKDLPRSDWADMVIASPTLVRSRSKLALLNRDETKNFGDEIWYYRRGCSIGVMVNDNNKSKMPIGVKVKYQMGDSVGQFCLGDVGTLVDNDWKFEEKNKEFLKKILK